MTAKKTGQPDEEDSLGVLDDAAPLLDTTAIGLFGGTAQVSVTIPTGDEDDLLDDAVVVEGEIEDHEAQDAALETTPAPAVAAVADDAPESDPQVEVEGESGEDDAEDAAAVVAAAEEADEIEAVEDVPVEDAHGAQDADAVEDADVSEDAEADDEPPAEVEPEAVSDAEAVADDEAVVTEPEADPADVSDHPTTTPARPVSEWVAQVEQAAAAASEPADPEPSAPEPAAPVRAASESSASEPAASVPAEKATVIVSSDEKTPRPAEVELTSRRLDDQLGQAARESADLLTADRLLDPHQQSKPEPEGAWSHFLYTVSGRLINIGDGRKARERKALSARIAAPLTGGARFVPVLSRKGGVGKTTITALLGMALADARDDRVIAVDANPDRGTLAERIVRAHGKSVRDLVRIRDEVRGYHDVSSVVARDATRLDVLASDSDPRTADAFGEEGYRDVAEVAAQYYSLVLTDTGTGIVHSVMGATLDAADQLVIVSGLSVDEARLASETLTWLEANGRTALAREAIVVLNQSTPGTPLVRLNELEAHFATRARYVVRMPYDGQIAGGGPIVFSSLQPETRRAARELAALLVEGLRARAA